MKLITVLRSAAQVQYLKANGRSKFAIFRQVHPFSIHNSHPILTMQSDSFGTAGYNALTAALTFNKLTVRLILSFLQPQ